MARLWLGIKGEGPNGRIGNFRDLMVGILGFSVVVGGDKKGCGNAELTTVGTM